MTRPQRAAEVRLERAVRFSRMTDMPPRLFIDDTLTAGRALALPERAARHVQVLRLQPGAALTLFDG